MSCAADFRRIAREALRGKWRMAVLVGLVAAMLGGAGAGGFEINLESDDFGVHANLDLAGQTIFTTNGAEPQQEYKVFYMLL